MIVFIPITSLSIDRSGFMTLFAVNSTRIGVVFTCEVTLRIDRSSSKYPEKIIVLLFIHLTTVPFINCGRSFRFRSGWYREAPHEKVPVSRGSRRRRGRRQSAERWCRRPWQSHGLLLGILVVLQVQIDIILAAAAPQVRKSIQPWSSCSSIIDII